MSNQRRFTQSNLIAGRQGRQLLTPKPDDLINTMYKSATVSEGGGGGGGPISYIADAEAGTSSGGNSLTIDKPTGTAENNLIVAVLSYNGGGPSSVSSAGWTQLEVEQVGAKNNFQMFLLYKIAGASEGSSYVFTDNGAGGSVRCGLLVTYENTATSSVVDDSADVADSSDGTTCVTPSVTSGGADHLAIVYAGPGTGTGTATTTPAGYTVRQNGACGSQSVIYYGDKITTASGATSNQTVEFSVSGSLGQTIGGQAVFAN